MIILEVNDIRGKDTYHIWEFDHHHLALKPPERVDYLKFRTVVRMTKQQKSNKQTKSYCKTIHSE